MVISMRTQSKYIPNNSASKLFMARLPRIAQMTALVVTIGLISGCGSMSDMSSKLKSQFQSKEVPPKQSIQEQGMQDVASGQQVDDSPVKEYVSPEDLQQVLPGMSHEEVASVLGQPILSDPDQRGRWDYVLKRSDGVYEEMIPFGVYFEAEQVVSVAALDMVTEEQKTDEQKTDEPIQVRPYSEYNETDFAQSGNVDTKPQPTSAPAPDPKVQEAQLISNLLSGWVSAWANQDVGSYLSFYAPNFQHGMRSRSAWESERQKRLSKPKSIAVSLSDVQINLISGSAAEVTFQQEYVASNYQDTGSKELLLTKQAGEWLIMKEEFSK